MAPAGHPFRQFSFKWMMPPPQRRFKIDKNIVRRVPSVPGIDFAIRDSFFCVASATKARGTRGMMLCCAAGIR